MMLKKCAIAQPYSLLKALENRWHEALTIMWHWRPSVVSVLVVAIKVVDILFKIDVSKSSLSVDQHFMGVGQVVTLAAVCSWQNRLWRVVPCWDQWLWEGLCASNLPGWEKL